MQGTGMPLLRDGVYSDVPEEEEEAAGTVGWYKGIRDDLPRTRLRRDQASNVSAARVDDASS